jgi:phage/plasmid-associated DNA primase
MKCTLGEYCQLGVPSTLITESEKSVGQTSSELIKLQGVRYFVIDETRKGVKFNDKVIKNLADCGVMQIRELYKTCIDLQPQYTPVLCTNHIPDTNNVTDDGLARRIRIVPHLTKFVKPDDTKKYKDEFIFPRDDTIKNKLPLWASTFAHILVMNAFKTQGVVNSDKCSIVMEYSNKYMKSQDMFSAFVNDRIVIDQHKSLGKQDINSEFGKWFTGTFNNRDTKPKASEIHEYITNILDIQFINNKWKGIAIRNDDYNKTDEDDEISALEN